MNKSLGNAIDTFLTVTPTTIGAGATESAVGATYLTGTDRLAYESAVFAFSNCAPFGTPTGITVTCKVYESSDDSTYTAISGAEETHNVTNSATVTEVEVDLDGVKKYVRGYMSVQFNGGSGPYIICDGIGILGMKREDG